MEELITEVTEEDFKNGVEDKFGVVYSRDGKRLLKCKKQKLKSFEIKNGTLVICDSAFKYCDALQNITIPNSVKSIGDNVFCYCESLVEITLSNSLITIGSEAFCECKSLQTVVLPDSIKEIGDFAFRGCMFLQQINIPKSVITIGKNPFLGCNHISLSSKSTRFVVKNGFFIDNNHVISYNCSDLVSSYSEPLTDNYKSRVWQFQIPNYVTSIGDYAFGWHVFGEELVIPNSVTSIGNGVFCHCRFLKSIIIPDTVISIGNMAFSDCEFFNPLTIPNSVISIGVEAFSNCVFLDFMESVESIKMSNSITYLGDGAFKESNVENITIPSSVITVSNCLFKDCRSLKKVNILSDSVSSIGNMAFMGCLSLESIDLPDSVKIIGSDVFRGCESLKEIRLQNTVVTTIGDRTFMGCNSLKDIILPNFVLSMGSDVFKNCESLESVTMLNVITKIEDGTFSGCSSLYHIDFPDIITEIGEYAFFKCASLQELKIPKSVTSIKDNAFALCESLQKVTFSDAISTIGKNAFWGCTYLKDVLNLESVTSIGDNAFYLCKSLQQIDISEVASIGKNVFAKCESLPQKLIKNYNVESIRIKKIVIQNFRAFKKAEINLDNFNCIIGKNDSGKSTIFAALEWFFDRRKELNEQDFSIASLIGKKSIYNKYKNNAENDCISVEICFCNTMIPNDFKHDNLTFNKDFTGRGNDICIKKYMYHPSQTRLDKRIGYSIKVYPFKREHDDFLFMNYSLDKLEKLYSHFFNDNLWSEVHHLEDMIKTANNIIEKEWYNFHKKDYLQEICDNLYNLYVEKYKIKENQWINLDNEVHLDWFDSYKFYLYTSNTSLTNYLNSLFEIKYYKLVEDTKYNMVNELSEMLTNHNISDNLGFKEKERIELFSDNTIFFTDNIPLNNRGEGIQLNIKNAVFKILTGIQSENQNTIFAFEEPETHLHPSAQIEMYETIKKLSENPNYQVFITTHSPYIVKQLAKDNIKPIVVKRDENLKASKISKLDERVLPYVSMNEMNFIAFDEPSIEYHIELFGFIQQKTKKNPGGVDSWLLENKYAKREYDYYQVDANSQLIPDKKGGFQHSDKTLPYCVRNQIDHPNDINKQYENRENIRCSIDIMRNAILNNPDIFQKKE